MCLYIEPLVEFDRDYNRATAIFPADSCCSTTFDLRYAAAAALHSNGKGGGLHALVHWLVFDGRPEAMNASSCELLVLLTFLLS